MRAPELRRTGLKQTPLVGREAELSEIRDVLRGAEQACGSIVVVSGEAGIGKSRLCRELLVEATARSMQTLVGRAYPEDAGVAFGPLVDALRSARRQAASSVWRSAISRSRLLSTILPELEGEAESSSTPANRALLFETLLDVVHDAARTSGLVWLLEDLHWADTGSWEFVFHAARRIASMPVALLVTIRQDELQIDQRWIQRLASFRREDSVLHVRLNPLSQVEIQQIVRAVAGPEIDPALVENIAVRSDGVPLLAEELVVMHAQAAEGREAVPDVVRATVRQRIQRLDQRLRDMLEVAAVVGPQPDLDLLLQLRPELENQGLQQLIESGLLVLASGPPPDQVSFRHSLLQEAVYADISWSRRRELHREIAQALTSQPWSPMERVAKHWEFAGEPDMALDVLVTGADQARADGNIGRAASLGVVGVDLADRYEQFASKRPDLRLATLRDLFRAGRWTEVTPLARAAWAELERGGSPARVAIANMLGLSLFYSGAVDDAASLVGREVAGLQYVEDTSSGALLLSTAAFIALFQGETSEALSLSEHGLELAHRAGDPEAEHRARNVRIMAGWRRDRDRQAAVVAHLQNAEFARQAGLTVAEANSWWNYAHMTTRLEDYLTAERAASRAGTWYAVVARLMQGVIHLLEGRPDDAERLLNQVRMEIRHGIPMMAGVMDGTDAHLLLHQGRLDDARDILSRRRPHLPEPDLPQWAAVRESARGWLAWEEADLQRAKHAFQISQQFCATVGYHAFELGPIFVALHVDALCRLDDQRAAARVIEEAADIHRVPDRFFSAALAAARFRLAPTPELATQASEAARVAPWPWLEALINCWRGEFLDDAQAATSSRERFASIGARRGMERAAAVSRRIGAPTGARHAATRGEKLSPREREVAELVAGGLTNAAIAERLFLSRPTVASHVANILAKLNFSSRTQVAAWVAAQRERFARPG